MGLLDLFRIPDVNEGVRQFAATPGALLLDVRTPQEYRQGHLPGSRNIPAEEIAGVGGAVPDPGTPIFVYCWSGARSRTAAGRLRRMGYRNVTNIGGINRYRGKVEL